MYGVDPEDAPHSVPLDRGWTVWRLGALRSAALPISRLDVLVGDDDRESRKSAIDALVGDAIFFHALIWQNPDAVDAWVGAHNAALAAGERPKVKSTRLGYRMATMARYAQRYCAKNETVGFFGPVAWARMGGPGTTYSGGGGIRRSDAYIEVWAVQSVVAAWNADPALREHLPARVDPACTVEGQQVVRPYRRPYEPTVEEWKVLVALGAGADRLGALASAGELAETGVVLDRLVSEGVVQVGFRVPISSCPLNEVKRQVLNIADEDVREPLLRRIDRLAAVVAEAGALNSPAETRQKLELAQHELDEAAGRPVRRDGTFTVGGRTPLYLDCRRDLDAVVGDQMLNDLARPLGILLDSARWLCGQVAEHAADNLRAVYRQLAPTRGDVRLSDLYMAAAEVLEPGGRLFSEVVEDFQMRWAELLNSADSSRVEVDEARARRVADVLFPAPRRLWAAARLHSPDLMVRRNSGGGLSWVLGELHVALNTLESRCFNAQADDPSELIMAMAADMAKGRVVPVYPNNARDVSSRNYPPLALDPPGHYRYVSFGSDEGHPSATQSTPATAVKIQEHGDELVAVCEPDNWVAPVIECFSENLSSVVVNLFQLRPPENHQPRVDMGALTVCRETWRVPVADLVPVKGTNRAASRAAVNESLTRLGVPRHVFARVPGDRKPFYVDRAAPSLVDGLIRAAGRSAESDPAGRLEVVEMLPDPTELWLEMADGSYTSELRLVVCDPEPAHPASGPPGQ